MIRRDDDLDAGHGLGLHAVLGRDEAVPRARAVGPAAVDVHVGRKVAARIDGARERKVDGDLASSGPELDLGRGELVLETARRDDDVAAERDALAARGHACVPVAAVARDVPLRPDGDARVAAPERDAVPGRERASGADLAQRSGHAHAHRVLDEIAEVELLVRHRVAQEDLRGERPARGRVVHAHVEHGAARDGRGAVVSVRAAGLRVPEPGRTGVTRARRGIHAAVVRRKSNRRWRVGRWLAAQRERAEREPRAEQRVGAGRGASRHHPYITSAAPDASYAASGSGMASPTVRQRGRRGAGAACSA